MAGKTPAATRRFRPLSASCSPCCARPGTGRRERPPAAGWFTQVRACRLAGPAGGTTPQRQTTISSARRSG